MNKFKKWCQRLLWNSPTAVCLMLALLMVVVSLTFPLILLLLPTR